MISAKLHVPAPYFIKDIVTLEKYGRFWQRRLRLTDWRVQFVWAKPGDIKESSLGQCRWNDTRKSARILIKPEHLREPKCPEDDSHEMIIIHELLHLTLLPICPDDSNTTKEELIVDSLMRGLYHSAYPKFVDPLTGETF